jgi:hypothetical protein
MDVRMPDGTIIQNVPNDFSKADLLARYQSFQGKSAAPDAGDPQVPGLSGGMDALSQVPRQLGLTVRAGAQGLGAIPNAIGDALGLNSSNVFSGLLDKVLPSPANGTERFANTVASGMVQPGLVAKALPQLGARIGTQILSAGAGAGSSDLAKEAGYGPMGQAVAGLTGGIAAPAAVAATGAAARAAMRVPGALAAPLTKGGQMDTAARIYQQSAQDPRQALANIQGAQDLVPGVTPTAAAVANDSGISSLYKTLRNQAPGQFADAETANDAARQAFLAKQFGNPSDLQAAKAARDAVTGPMREAAFSGAGPVDTAPIVQAGTSALESGAKYRGSGPMLQKFVNDISQINDPQVLYNGPRKAISDAIAGKVSQDSPLASFTKAELMNLRGAIDDQIESVAPGFKAYLGKHADLSRQIDAKALGQQITQGSLGPQTDQISGAKFARAMVSNAPDVARGGAASSDALMRVNEDLKRAVAPMNTMRAAGSDTTQNLVGNQILQSMLGKLPGGPISGAASKLTSLLYSPAEARIRQLLISGQLDPQLGVGLLGRSLPLKPDLMRGLLAQRLPIAYGGLLGAMSAQ